MNKKTKTKKSFKQECLPFKTNLSESDQDTPFKTNLFPARSLLNNAYPKRTRVCAFQNLNQPQVHAVSSEPPSNQTSHTALWCWEPNISNRRPSCLHWPLIKRWLFESQLRTYAATYKDNFSTVLSALCFNMEAGPHLDTLRPRLALLVPPPLPRPLVGVDVLRGLAVARVALFCADSASSSSSWATSISPSPSSSFGSSVACQ